MTARIRPLRRKGLSFPKVARLVLVAATVLWVGTLAYESVGSLPKRIAGFASPRQNVDSDDLLVMDSGGVKEEPLEVATLLPATADGWLVQGPQLLPGSSGDALEAYFNPRDDELKLVTPLIVYVRVQRLRSPAEAERHAQTALKRGHPRADKTVTKRNIAVSGAATTDSRSYALAFTRGSYSYWLDAAYTDFVPPVDPLERLKEAALRVAEEVLRLPPPEDG